ncbi:HNH endonuclease [Sphingobium estronivorans]|uniref:HNH endonuclease n=1 Tax=Sphingobium estronivorans TaxID=1577690 RepID=UPI003B849727
MDSGCFYSISHKTNQDDYLYKTWTVDGEKVREAFHRFTLRAHNDLDAIPDGYEVDHICGNRPCCNPKHLRLIERSDHKRVTNMMRYADRHERARLHWETHRHSRRVTGEELGGLFGVDQSCACRWIRAWKAEEAV